MAGHHYAGFHGDPSLADALLAERNRLVSSIMSLHPAAGGIHGSTIQAVRDLLWRFPDAGIPWVRMYHSFPPWQQRCGLLQENWDGNAVAGRAKVIFTLITPMGGGAISRKALGAGGGTWKSTGAEPIGSGEVVLSKLYLKRDDGSRGGLTAFEFHLTATADRLQPRVAICVLHPTDYRDCVRDLKECCDVGYFPGGNPPLAPIYSDPHGGAGFMNGPHVGYTNNRAYYSGRNIPGANEVDQMAVQHQGQHLDPDAGFMNGLIDDYTINLASGSGLYFGAHQSEFEQQQTSYTQSLTVSSGIPLLPISHNEVYHPVLPENNSLMETYYSQPLNSSLEVPSQVPQQIVTQDEDLFPLVLSQNNSVFQSSGYHPSTEIQRNIPSNTYSINDSMHYMPWGTNMTNDNEPLLEPFSLSDWVIGDDHAQGGVSGNKTRC